MSADPQTNPEQAAEAEAEAALKPSVASPSVASPSVASRVTVESLAELISLRTSKGFDASRVSARLRLAPRQVIALEAGDWAALPGRTFIRLTLRSYGRLLEADVSHLLDAIESQLPGTEVLKPASDLKRSLPRRGALGFGGSGSGSSWVWLILLVAGIVVLSFFYGGGAALLNRASPVPGGASGAQGPTAGSSERTALGRPASETESAAPLVASTAAAPSAVARPPASTSAAPAPAVLASASLASAAPMSATPTSTALASTAAGSAQTVPAGAAIAQQGVNPAQAAGGGSAPNPLVMRFPAASWIEVRDGSGVVLVTGTQEPGSVRELAGEPPLSLIIGNASGVSVSWRGAPIDVGAHMRQGVARFRIE